jgi:hypothetical protein
MGTICDLVWSSLPGSDGVLISEELVRTDDARFRLGVAVTTDYPVGS